MTPKDVATQLENTIPSLRQVLKHVDNDLATWRSKEDAWCINEVIGHLIWTDTHAFMNRIKIMSEQTSDTLPSIDVNQAAKDRKDATKKLSDILNEFEKSRIQSVTYVNKLEPSSLANSAKYKERIWLASDFLYEWPFHDYGHIAQIMRNLRANLAPYMSDTMRKAVGY